MLDTLILILSVILFGLLFNYLFYKLNDRFGLFESIQNKIENLDEDKNKKIRMISYILVIVIVMIFIDWETNYIIKRVFFGVLFSTRDICFKNTFMDNMLK